MSTTTTCTVDSLVANAPLVMTCSAPDEAPMWTDVFSAWGTVGATAVALLFGFVSLVISIRDHRARLRDDADREEEEHQAEQRAMRRQAQRVACWLQVDWVNHSHHVIVENASDEPVWAATFSHPTVRKGTLIEVPVLAPGSRKEFEANPRAGWDVDEIVEVQFLDNAGNSWRRPSDKPGTLVQITEKKVKGEEEAAAE